jgi:hypothetical protein
VLSWAFLGRSDMHELAAERRALEARAADLIGRALQPGSALACLDGMAGEAAEGGCEPVVFASPESLSGAVSYVAARLLLLADGLEFAGRSPRGFEAQIAELRRTAELDRFGMVSHVLATRHGCTADKCDAFLLFRDAGIIQGNLKERTYQGLVARYAAGWSKEPVPSGTAAAPAPAPPGQASRNIDFPSASSIPPVSIMNNEPTTPPPAVAGRAGGEPGGAESVTGAARRGAAPGAPGDGQAARRNPPRRQTPPAPPVQIVPAPSPNGGTNPAVPD